MGEVPGQYSRLAGIELCGSCFTLHFFPENGDGGFRLFTAQSLSLLSCLMLNGSSPRCSITLYTVLSFLSLTLPGKEQSPAPPNSISLWTLLCCSNRGLLFCLQGELPTLQNQGWQYRDIGMGRSGSLIGMIFFFKVGLSEHVLNPVKRRH